MGDLMVTIKVAHLEKILETLMNARNPSVAFSRDPEVVRERAMDCIERELDSAIEEIKEIIHQ